MKHFFPDFEKLLMNSCFFRRHRTHHFVLLQRVAAGTTRVRLDFSRLVNLGNGNEICDQCDHLHSFKGKSLKMNTRKDNIIFQFIYLLVRKFSFQESRLDNSEVHQYITQGQNTNTLYLAVNSDFDF